MKFQIGDKVRVYGLVESQWSDEHGAKRYCFHSRSLTIREFRENGQVQLECYNGVFCYANIKQCRKLKPKKKRREIWVNGIFCVDYKPVKEFSLPVITDKYPADNSVVKVHQPADGWIKFREVVEK